jgi:hypothetical protein
MEQKNPPPSPKVIVRYAGGRRPQRRKGRMVATNQAGDQVLVHFATGPHAGHGRWVPAEAVTPASFLSRLFS